MGIQRKIERLKKKQEKLTQRIDKLTKKKTDFTKKVNVLTKKLDKRKKLQDKMKKLKMKIERGLIWKKQYVYYLEHCKVKEKSILLESQLGGSLGGNIFAILRELCENPDYKNYKIHLTCKPEQIEARKAFLALYGLDKRTKILSTTSKAYYKTLATAKYLINDNTFIHVFTKRPEQVYFNTWHGTPFKTLGKKIKKDFAGIGNAQHTMYTSDYLLYPNEFTMEHMVEDYMLPNWASGRVLLAGYPRNEAFLTQKRRDEIRRECGMENMEVYAYLPTWRGIVGNVTSKQQNDRLYKYLAELDGKLADNQRVYVKLHPVSVKDIDLSKLSKVVPFPADKYETYEFLSATDGLITDYSSIFFDYAVSRKKIILFAYDKAEYIADRGFYFSMDELPFPQATNVDELLACINAPKSYDDTEFIKKFCAYEKPGITNALLRRVLFGEKSSMIKECDIPNNGKKNVVVYAGSMKDTRITRDVFEFFKTADRKNYNYMLIFKIEDLKKFQHRLRPLPADVDHFGHYDNLSLGIFDMLIYKLWRDYKKISYEKAKKVIEKKARFEMQRILGGVRVDTVIQFSGYTVEMIAGFQAMPCRRVIFAHNDMAEVARKAKTMDIKLLRDAYREYDTVAVTSEANGGIVRRIAEDGVKELLMVASPSQGDVIL